MSRPREGTQASAASTVEWRQSKSLLFLFLCLWMLWPDSLLPCLWILRWDILFLSSLQMVTLLLLLLLAFGSTGTGFWASHTSSKSLYCGAIATGHHTDTENHLHIVSIFHKLRANQVDL